MGRNKKYVISLTDDVILRLKVVLRKNWTTWTIKCRCQILLALNEAHGKPHTQEQCAKSIGVCNATVCLWQDKRGSYANLVNTYIINNLIIDYAFLEGQL